MDMAVQSTTKSKEPAKQPAKQLDHLDLLSGLMRRFAQTGDAIDGLKWALPYVLETLSAEAGSLFLHRPDEGVLECVVCVGPVDVTGLKVPSDKGLVGRAFTEGNGELVADASQDKAHYKAADSGTGFQTLSTATAPVKSKDKNFGAIQAINRRDGDAIGNFAPSDLTLLEALAEILALALSNVELTEQAISDKLLQRDLSQAEEAQASLLPAADPDGFAAGHVIPARQLSGDFFDHMRVGRYLAFCQGDVAGKGITASLMMARSIALFRRLARQELPASDMANAINYEFLDVASDKFVTFAVGWMDCETGDVSFVNCGHGAAVIVRGGDAPLETIESQTVPLGLVPYSADELVETKLNVTDAHLFLTTDGITEAEFKGREVGLSGLASLSRRLPGHSAVEKVSGIISLFETGKLSTHDDATILVVTRPSDQGVSSEGGQHA